MFLADNWNAGSLTDFGHYFATLIFVVTLCFVVEAVPYIRNLYFNPNNTSKAKAAYAEVVNLTKSNYDTNEKHFTPLSSPAINRAPKIEVSLAWHLLDSFLQLIAKICMYLLMLSVMSYNFGVILTASVAFPLANFIFSIL